MTEFTWDYVEFELDDPRLGNKYKIVRMLGFRGGEQYTPWDVKAGDFKIVSD